MQDFLKKAILRLFPELSGGLHLDRYGRVLAIADAPSQGASSERFRPRFAADIEILTADMEPDPAFPHYTAVPLPVPLGAGGEAGVFAPPRPGALVVVGFAYGRQDHPIIRQMYGMGDSLPQVGPEEMLLQQSPTTFQRADAGGNWSRQTDAEIADKSVTRRIEAMESTTELARETRRISEHSTLEVDGTHTLEVGTVLTMLAGLRADVGSLGALNLTAGGDSTHSTAGAAQETVGKDHASKVTGNRQIDIAGNRGLTVKGSNTDAIVQNQAVNVGGRHTDIAKGDRNIEAANITLRARGRFTIIAEGEGGSINLYNELLDCLADIRAALDVLAMHDHPNAGTINQGGAVSSNAAGAEGHRQKMKGITG
ncbi:hypothetical protein [Desulfovibrio desulfuricans]|uniref:hypothetical protein n=1 Tax=Desulfovibrio desulfuricans TaxID=876 RepID=UPI0003B36152|nr:hypothetical protein [Desulfovibrio desulfuricans]